jgi:hypothetical protein
MELRKDRQYRWASFKIVISSSRTEKKKKGGEKTSLFLSELRQLPSNISFSWFLAFGLGQARGLHLQHVHHLLPESPSCR